MKRSELLKDYLDLGYNQTIFTVFQNNEFIKMGNEIKETIFPQLNCDEKEYDVNISADIGNIVLHYLDEMFYLGVDAACYLLGEDQPFQTLNKIQKTDIEHDLNLQKE